jgi:hypothetical protein
MLDDVLVSKQFAGVSARCLAIAIYAREAENMVERLVSLRQEDDCWPKTSNVGREMDEKMEFGFANQNTRRTLSRHIQKVLNCSC